MQSAAAALSTRLGADAFLARLGEVVEDWVARADPALHDTLRWQLLAPSKRFRPLTLFACWQAAGQPGGEDAALRRALAIELLHNLSLVVDDILDRSRRRRGRLTLHCRFGTLPALMTAGYLQAGAFAVLHEATADTALAAELLKRLAVAEVLQWRSRRLPRGVEDWRRLAGEDTGALFELCAALGAGDGRLRRFGHLLGVLYHGCDDVADVRGSAALGGGGHADLRDGILTLPAALAVRDAAVAARFAVAGEGQVAALGTAFRAQLGAAEAVLDGIAAEACEEAELHAAQPAPLLALVAATRGLSRS